MTKIPLIFMLLFLSTQVMFAQKTKTFFLDAGPTFSRFQDQKYSAVQYNGTGVGVNIGRSITGAKSMMSYGLKIRVGQEAASTHDKGNTTLFQPNLFVNYSLKINERFSMGVHWDVFGVYSRNTDGLMNNSSYTLGYSDLMLKTNLIHKKWHVGLDIGLVSFSRENTGFAFSVAQQVMTNGEFSYQNEEAEQNLNLKYFDVQGPDKNLKLRTNINYQLSNRIGFGYEWEMRRFVNVATFPAIYSMHHLAIRWNFIYR